MQEDYILRLQTYFEVSPNDFHLLNSVNQDKIQKWYGYQRHSTSDNRYIPRGSGKKDISISVFGMVSIHSGESKWISKQRQ